MLPRIVGSAALQATAVVAIPLVASQSPWAPVVLMFVCGLGTAIMQASVMGVVSRFPPEYSAGFMLGQGVIGVTSSALQVSIKAAVQSQVAPDGSLPDAVNAAAATGYFVFAAALMVACGAGFYIVDQTPFADFYLRDGRSKADSGVEGGSDAGRARAGSGGDDEDDDGGASSSSRKESSGSGEGAQLLIGGRTSAAGASASSARGFFSPALLSAASKARVYILALFLVFFVTFLLFPTVLLDRIPYRGGFGSRAGFLGTPRVGWWSVVLLAVFNTFDTVGRSLAGARAFSAVSSAALLVLVVARTAFIALLLGCALGWGPAFGDATTAVMGAAFALTNGLFASLAFIGAPQAPGVTPAERQSVGMLLSIALNLGILAGSNAAFMFASIPATP